MIAPATTQSNERISEIVCFADPTGLRRSVRT